MPKKISEETLRCILTVIAKFPDGVTLSTILESLKNSIPKRTVQRYLADLVQERLIFTEGESRGRKYKLQPKELSATPREKALKNSSERIIPLSLGAQEIEEQISQPLQTRTHVSYRRKFLDAYRPNTTYYLNRATRDLLREMGGSEEKNRPAGTFARKIFNRLLIDLSWNSSRLEGNTYSLLETEKLLKFNEPTEGKDLKETQMILNHKAAIEFLVDSPLAIDRFTLLNLHALLSNNLLRDPAACGRLRSIPVGISSTVYVPLAIPHLIEECFDQIINTACVIKDPIEQAFFLMVHLPYLQPFEDVNKRVSRLAANIPLIKENLCPLSFVDVPEETYINGLLGIYELNQVELMCDIFVWAYKRSCSLYAATKKSLGEPDPFRLRYRDQITHVIQRIIHEKMDKKGARSSIESGKKMIPQEDQKQFLEVVEEELLGLHEGNIARYKIGLNAYEKWRSIWE